MCCFRLHFSDFNVLFFQKKKIKTSCSLLFQKKITCCAEREKKVTCHEKKSQTPFGLPKKGLRETLKNYK